jgi:cell division septation protein DedD
MPTAQQDTEITLGTGRMLAIFFAFVLVCAFFFAIGFSLGRKTTLATIGGVPSSPTGASSTAVRPSAEKKEATPQANSTDFSFYKAVGEKSADTGLTPPDSSKTPSATSPAPSAPAGESSPNPAPDMASVATGYFVQVAAVSRKEDAESLVEALKKKQYPAFSANNPVIDKFYHVQVGPYGELKDAEAMRARLIGDGYNPIVKK